jgi:nitronate monooxygenase
VSVAGAREGEETDLTFDPAGLDGREPPPLKRPFFFPIVSSVTLAALLLRKSNGRVDGFVVEGSTAGGHNAPPRGRLHLSASGEPVYGERDEIDLAKMRELPVPFWLAGGRGTREGLRHALDAGAAGIQVGTAFAFCEESGLDKRYKALLLRKAADGTSRVFTDPVASPTGFPFKVADLEGSLSKEDAYLARTRVCDLGYLREAYRREDGSVGLRCPAEPAPAYVVKGGSDEETHGRKCLCNALTANIGLAQVRRDGAVELPLITSGDDLAEIRSFLPSGASSYSASDVVTRLLGE